MSRLIGSTSDVADAAAVRIVGDKDIARVDIVAELGDYRLDGRIEHADETRNTGARAGQLTVNVGDGHAEIEHLIDHRAHGGAGHRSEHFIRDGGQRKLNDFRRKRIRCPGVEHLGVQSVRPQSWIPWASEGRARLPPPDRARPLRCSGRTPPAPVPA